MNLTTTRARVLAGSGIALAAVAVIGGTATAASQITAHELGTGSVNSRVIKDGSVHQADLTPKAMGLLNSGLHGAYYAVAKYDSGDTNGGAIATVACKAQTDVALAGGVQTLGLLSDNSNNVPVSSSFPGRMDWSTNTPFAGRQDGWIVQFGTETGAAPTKANIWALCVPGAKIPVKTTYTESASQ